MNVLGSCDTHLEKGGAAQNTSKGETGGGTCGAMVESLQRLSLKTW